MSYHSEAANVADAQLSLGPPRNAIPKMGLRLAERYSVQELCPAGSDGFAAR